ncbi:hypothetical protein [Legionella drozanskii]|nr:hypothetical protein [Legionella drozanskii]
MIDAADIDEQGMLLPLIEIERLKAIELKEGLNCKKDTQCKYNILVKNGELFAIYCRPKQSDNKLSRHNNIKYVQDLQTGKWIVKKLESFHGEDEVKTLSKLGLVVETNTTHTELSFFRNSKTRGKMVHEFMIHHIDGINLKDFFTGKIQYFTKFTRVQLAIDLIQKLIHLHQNNISHNDSHSENIMYVPAKLQFEIIDFGSAKELNITYSNFDRFSINNHLVCLLKIDQTRRQFWAFLAELQKSETATDDAERSINILNNELKFLINEKNKIPANERELTIGVFDIGLSLPFEMDQLKQFPLVILIDSSNQHSALSFAKWKHDLAKQQVFVYDQAISTTNLRSSQYITELHNLMQAFNPECNFNYIDARTGIQFTSSLARLAAITTDSDIHLDSQIVLS